MRVHGDDSGEYGGGLGDPVTLLSLLLLTACAHPTAWRVELLPGVESEPSGWREVMEAARAEAPCSLRWGGVIRVHPAPYMDGWGRTVWGNVVDASHVGIAWTEFARDGALPEEGCHVGLQVCQRNYWEPPAWACAERVRGRLAP